MAKNKAPIVLEFAKKNGCCVNDAYTYKYRLEKLLRFGCVATPPTESFLTSLDGRQYYHFALYYYCDGERKVWGTNEYHRHQTPDEVMEFANEHLIPYYLLPDDFAKACEVPVNTIQLLRMTKLNTIITNGEKQWI